MRLALKAAWIVSVLAASSGAARAGYAPGCTVALNVPGALSHQAHALAIQADGKIVVAGYVDFGLGRDFLVARFHPDLSLDTSFNGIGYRADDLQGLDDAAFAVAVQPDQKIVLAGASQKSAGQNWIAFTRYNRDGSLDASFGPGGLSLIDFTGSSVDELRAVAIQPDGKIVGAGFLTPSGIQRLAVVRLRKDGNLDATFDGDGAAQPTITGSAFSFARGVAVDPQGRILVSGEARFTTSDFLTVRLMPDGTLDGSFSGGWVATDIAAGTIDSASSLLLQPDGKIVVAGTSSGNAAVARYDPNGSLDTFFGGTGRILHDFGAADQGNALAMDGLGNLLIAGSSSLPPSSFAFARFWPDGMTDLSRTDSVSSMEDRAFGIAAASGGKLLVAGSTGGALEPRTTLALYEPDGTQSCGSLSLHPTGDGLTGFTPLACLSSWDCVNDQPANDPEGAPASDDGSGSSVQSGSSPALDLYRLDDGYLPPGKAVTEIEIVAQLAWGGGGSEPTAELLYERQGFDTGPVAGDPVTISSPGFQEVRARFTALNWSAAELDALEIGLHHTGGNDLLLTQIYVRVTLGQALVHPVPVFTAGASGDAGSGQVMLNWLNPSYGIYDRTVIRRGFTCPLGPGDGVPVASLSDGLGQPGSFVDDVPLGPTYVYGAFVLDAEGHASTGVCASAAPFDRTLDKVDWVYDTSISALATPGLRSVPALGESVVYAVSNDGLVHALRGGLAAAGGGSWPPGWKPFRIGASAQARPPVVPLPPSGNLALLLGAQDGHAYAIDAVTGDLMWKSAKLGANLQAAPGFDGAANLVFVGTRNTGSNRIYALNGEDGAVAWLFDNGGDPTGIGRIVNGPSVDAGSRRVYFTSAKGTSGNSLWCLDYASNPPQPCWSSYGVATSGGFDVEAGPVLFQGSIFVPESSTDGHLYAVNPADGTDLLVFPLNDGGAKGFVFPQLGSANLFASTSTSVMSVRIGAVNWTHSCVDTPSTPTAVPGTDWIFVGSSEGKLFQLSASGGCSAPRNLCIGDCLSTVVGAPAYDVLKTMLYAGTEEGKLYGVRAPF